MKITYFYLFDTLNVFCCKYKIDLSKISSFTLEKLIVYNLSIRDYDNR